MNREEFIRHVAEHYAVEPDYPWAKYPEYAVFRHRGSRKWFAVLMNVPSAYLGLAESSGKLDIVNVKVRPDLVGSLRTMKGILPAYHMNKEHWLSMVLSEVGEQVLLPLLDDSFMLTGTPSRR
ncbi:MmcQ/YjbR family DNA-binding protein [Neisseria animalis]|uniref:MmcQ protein n=1 Tax=Neisseria animalis TaxID=492 RepID=A0A5P3MNJ0_NEIAN|nr:MmcQ/YjbR family DNA-binding protein [Neisseria animalis]QEY23112.1 hypothetical protein D0T90_00150 [Neisseria animalis]ROW32444.1 hypothetical protein CGZ60_04850 [Neisseria animalis]VEE08158.1 Uncharacterized protein conserved in bacteria [Neisseria animalis]